MAIIGNTVTSVPFIADSFSGNASTTSFSPLTRAPAGTASIAVFIAGTYQAPGSYTLSGTTITFASPPASGVGNIIVLHLGTGSTTQVTSDGSVTLTKLSSDTFSYINTAFTAANTPSYVANSAASYANAAFATANTGTASGSYANSAFLTANTPSHVANSAASYANAAFATANTGTASGSYANSGFAVANSAASYANSGFAKANSVVTSIVAGSGISISGATGAVTITASGGGVTSLNGQTGSITDTSVNAIGSVMELALYQSGSGVYTGQTVSGSILYYATGVSAWTSTTQITLNGSGQTSMRFFPGVYLQRSYVGNSGIQPPSGSVTTLSGTWRCMTLAVGASSSTFFSCDGYTNVSYGLGQFVRVS